VKRSATIILAIALPLAACAPSHILGDTEVPKATDLGDVMWSQAQVMDPAFKKIGAATYVDADWTAFAAAAGRLQITTTKIKASFSKGPEFDQFADTLAQHARDLGVAAQGKDAAAAQTALVAARDTCRACHKKFR
jgi:hypothetical protein